MKTRIFSFVLISFLLTGCQSKEKSTENVLIPVNAKVEVIGLQSVDQQYEAVGTVQSKTSSLLSSKVMGQIVGIYVKEGDLVRTGQLLVDIDDRDGVAQLNKARAGLNEVERSLEEAESAVVSAQSMKSVAEANLNLASVTYQRYKALLERQSVSKQEFDEIEAKYKASLAEVERTVATLQMIEARKNQALAKIEQLKADVAMGQVYLDYSKIRSPIDGIVTMKNGETGNLAVPGSPLLKIEGKNNYRLEVAVEESQIARVYLNQQVTVSIDAIGNLIGKVAEILPTNDPASRSFIVKIELPEEQLLRSGSFGKAMFSVGQKQIVMLPPSALVERGQLTGVYVLDEKNIARLRLIKTGRQYNGKIEVVSGLKDGERIVSRVTEQVNDGSNIAY